MENSALLYGAIVAICVLLIAARVKKSTQCGCLAENMQRAPNPHQVRLRWGFRPPRWIDPNRHIGHDVYPQPTMPREIW